MIKMRKLLLMGDVNQQIFDFNGMKAIDLALTMLDHLAIKNQIQSILILSDSF